MKSETIPEIECNDQRCEHFDIEHFCEPFEVDIGLEWRLDGR